MRSGKLCAALPSPVRTETQIIEGNSGTNIAKQEVLIPVDTKPAGGKLAYVHLPALRCRLSADCRASFSAPTSRKGLPLRHCLHRMLGV